ncbi:class I SAM-dependent methyltransferase [Desulfovibrio cuneatus]|uniref:class I SAM-dependent methyltransferase n=1 Tax=Desulfovibrio cuneatus TaxID=159728 RepID=UPI00068595C0|nr:class I SAM-dependent methyltransferase [Desulfovibrio cuneatus]
MAYHDFPWQKGSSNSFHKLLSLSLPVLQGKRVLDVGCNEGYFCGWAAFQKASYVHGIDYSPQFIANAKAWFPSCSFSCSDWNSLGSRMYDVILCLSALHYAPDQEAFIHRLMERLDPSGVLVLEIGVVESEEDSFVPVKRAMRQGEYDIRLFPTFAKVSSMLASYAFKYMGPSVQQAGDPLGRHVFHVQHKRPLAVLFMDAHYSGKSSVASALLRPEIPRIFGEALYHKIADGGVATSDALKAHMVFVEGTRHMIPPQITRAIAASGLLPEFVRLCCSLAGGKDFVLEQYIPEEYRLEVAGVCQDAGFFVVDVALFSAYGGRNWVTKRPPYAHYLAYSKYLERQYLIDEEAYLAANPDVAQAVADGAMPSASYHHWYFGKEQKRRLRPGQ